MLLRDVAIKTANAIPALARLYMLDVNKVLKIIPLTSSPCVFPVLSETHDPSGRGQC